jgi:hypothetical protein
MTNPARELRALPLFNEVPSGCRTLSVVDDRHAPHLRAGETAVYDPSDRTAVRDELYVVMWSSRRPQIMAVRRGRPDVNGQECWWLAPLYNPPVYSREWWHAARSGTLVCSDGPYDGPEDMGDCIVGRVLGIFASAFDESALRTVGRAS